MASERWSPAPVVVPTDLSDESGRALERAAALVTEVSNIHLVHAIPSLAASEPGVIWQTIDNQERFEHAKKTIREHVGSDYENLQIHVEVGDPARVICDVARNIDAELIVTSSHGRSGFQRFILGSVAERVVRLASCDVLVVKPDQKESESS